MAASSRPLLHEELAKKTSFRELAAQRKRCFVARNSVLNPSLLCASAPLREGSCFLPSFLSISRDLPEKKRPNIGRC